MELPLPCEHLTSVEQVLELLRDNKDTLYTQGMLVLRTGLLPHLTTERRALADFYIPREGERVGGKAPSLLGDMVLQTYHDSTAPMCKWEDMAPTLATPLQFKEVTQELQEALQALHAVCNENDECQDFTCFVEAVAATATTLSMLYAPAMDLTRLQHGTLTPEGSPWGCTVLSKAGLLGKCAMLGISTGVGICSAAFTTALMHPEDMGLPSLNLELDGDHKIWYWVPSSRLGDFLHVLKKLLPDGAIKPAAATMAYCKMLSPVLTAN